MEARELTKDELVFCNGSHRLGVIIGFYGTDWQECNLWELHDGMGHQWLCPEYLIQRLPDNWDDMTEKAKASFR
jgi:hypothetical protein